MHARTSLHSVTALALEQPGNHAVVIVTPIRARFNVDRAREIERRTSFHCLRRPPPQVLEDAPDDSRILDKRHEVHRAFALRTLRQISQKSSARWL